MIELAAAYMGAGRPLIPLMLDGDAHTKYRKLLDPLFAPKVIARARAAVRALADELIDGFVADGKVEFFNAFCEPLPTEIFLTQLGLPLDDLAVPPLVQGRDHPADRRRPPRRRPTRR